MPRRARGSSTSGRIPLSARLVPVAVYSDPAEIDFPRRFPGKPPCGRRAGARSKSEPPAIGREIRAGKKESHLSSPGHPGYDSDRWDRDSGPAAA